MPNVVHMAYVVTRKDSLLLLMAAGKIRDKLNFEVSYLIVFPVSLFCSIYTCVA